MAAATIPSCGNDEDAVAPTAPFTHAARVPVGVNHFLVQTAGDWGAPDAVCVLCAHGANYSAASFALLAGLLAPRVAVAAYDARGHGRTTVTDAREPTAATLTDDLFAVAAHLGRRHAAARAASSRESQQQHADSSSNSAIGGAGDAPLRVVLLGHSMAGAIVTHAAARWPADGPPGAALAGLVVLDVVGSAALAALPSMAAAAAALAARRFPSLPAAVEWAVASETVRLRASAERSVPCQVQRVADDEDDGGSGGGHGSYRFIAAPFLTRSAPHWAGWFAGTTARFLAFPGPRLLVLADVGSMDRDLTIAQMGGRFALAPVHGAGHVVHEDAPDQVAAAVVAFLARNRLLPGGGGADGSGGALAARLARARAAAVGEASPPSAAVSAAGASPVRSPGGLYAGVTRAGATAVGSDGGSSAHESGSSAHETEK